MHRGVARIWQGGGARIIFLDFVNNMLLMALPCALLGGFGGMSPPLPIFFFKWCNLVRFGVYLNQIWSLKNFLKYHFLLHLVGLRLRVYYTLTNFRGGGGQGPLGPPQYANDAVYQFSLWETFFRVGETFPFFMGSFSPSGGLFPTPRLFSPCWGPFFCFAFLDLPPPISLLFFCGRPCKHYDII